MGKQIAVAKNAYALPLKKGGSVQEHIKKLTETSRNPQYSPAEEDQVVHMQESLPDSYSILITALEANAEVPKMEIIVEQLLHEERKQKDKDQQSHRGLYKALVSGDAQVLSLQEARLHKIESFMSKVHHKFRAEALLTAVYLRNRSPPKNSQGNDSI